MWGDDEEEEEVAVEGNPNRMVKEKERATYLA